MFALVPDKVHEVDAFLVTVVAVPPVTAVVELVGQILILGSAAPALLEIVTLVNFFPSIAGNTI